MEAGGETIFPSANVNKSVVVYKKDGLSECGQSGLAVKPRRGDALLFWSMRPDTSVDPSSLHGKIGATLHNLFSCFFCFIAIYPHILCSFGVYLSVCLIMYLFQLVVQSYMVTSGQPPNGCMLMNTRCDESLG